VEQWHPLLPTKLEVASLTLSLTATLDLTCAFGSDGVWVYTSSRLTILKIRYDSTGGP
jgi:hypothetical protein